MYTVKLAEKEVDFVKLDEACHYIPSGRNVWEGRMERFDLTQLRCYRSLRDAKRLERSLGTLGGGNHFIEVDQAADGTCYLVIHSGSRNLGKQVAEVYQQLAIDLHMGKEDYFRQRDEIIRTYKAEGRRAEIQEALKELKNNYETQDLLISEDICWLYGTFFEDYLYDVEICQRFAKRNRERMAEIILERTGMTAVESFHTIHNYIDVNEMILRKGAIAAHAGEKVLTHIDAVPDNFLFVEKDGKEEIRLIDWEYAGMQDPHVDVAMFCIYSLYNKRQVDRLIAAYFTEGCDDATRIKIYCYIAACGLLWSNWCEYKRNLGVEFGEYSLRQYRYAKDYYRIVQEELKKQGEEE